MGLTRRELLISAGIAGGGLAVGGVGGLLAASESAAADGTGVVPFHGQHQAGILTAQQDRLHFAAFDLTTDRIDDVRDHLREWTEAAARMTRGELLGEPGESPEAPPTDTGEAVGLLPSRLTITFGFGPSLFKQGRDDRFGLAKKMPKALAPLPALPSDALDPEISDGDLCVQACSDDPQTAFHAIRNLTRIARGRATLRWSQVGFGRTSSTSKDQQTPRNLFGFKDGTNNITAEEPAEAHNRSLWVNGGDGPEWMTGGSYMVTRRIRMLIEIWDRTSLSEQDAVFGRQRHSGAPIGGQREHDVPNLKAIDPDGKPLIPADAHIRLASPGVHNGLRILRRGYSFTDGFDSQLGQLDAGLFFICFQRNAHEQFVPLQTALGKSDHLNEYILHRSSALFAVPPGIPNERGRYIGDKLLS